MLPNCNDNVNILQHMLIHKPLLYTETTLLCLCVLNVKDLKFKNSCQKKTIYTFSLVSPLPTPAPHPPPPSP